MQRVITQLVSDLSGQEIVDGDGRTVSFSFEGTDYTVDLTSKEAEKFEKATQPYVDVATKVAKRRATGSTSTKSYDAKVVRQWAQDNGIDVPSRGRIPATVLEQYKQAN